MTPYIFHIVEKNIWDIAIKKGIYKPLTLKESGFIHCSKADQTLEVAKSFYQDSNHLIILRIKTSLVKPELKMEVPVEAPYSMIEYPHLYGPLNLDAVENEIPLTKNNSGNFMLPDLFN